MTVLQRLAALIQFVQHTARLHAAPVTDLAKHGDFLALEAELHQLPGISLNREDDEGEEIWLAVERLQPLPMPQPEAPLLQCWLEPSATPHKGAIKPPALTPAIPLTALEALGYIRGELAEPARDVALSDFSDRARVEALFEAYRSGPWQAWADAEQHRQKTMALYNQLFRLKQTLDGMIADNQLEIVWGSGVAVWLKDGVRLCYPLLTRPVELTLNSGTMALELRPRDLPATLEADALNALDAAGLADFERQARQWLENATHEYSPFDSASYQPLLQAAAAHLDPDARLLPRIPDTAPASLPSPDGQLQLVDSWAVFARPRTANLLVQDLQRFSDTLPPTPEPLPPALAQLLSEPSNQHLDRPLPAFRGLSAVSGSNDNGTARDLFFPKPFNDEQVRIVQMLELHDGVVVQGPPGTGKTHTIANIICHYLAQGQRVLVTSMKEPALKVLEEKLPDAIRPLAISLLAGERDEAKRFEYSVNKIASEIQSLDRTALARSIAALEDTIDRLHGNLQRVDREIDQCAARNLQPLTLDEEQIDPLRAAEQIGALSERLATLPDELTSEERHRPQFDDDAITRLRAARRELGAALAYLPHALPDPAELPAMETLHKAHQGLLQAAHLRHAIASGDVPALADGALNQAAGLAEALRDLSARQVEIASAAAPWARACLDLLRLPACAAMLRLLEEWDSAAEAELARRPQLLQRPVTLPDGLEQDAELVEAIGQLAAGRSAFGLAGWFGKGEAKKRLAHVEVLGQPAQTSADWGQVAAHLQHRQALRRLLLRWNAIATEFGAETLASTDPLLVERARERCRLIRRMAEAVQLEAEVLPRLRHSLPDAAWPETLLEQPARLLEAQRILLHHLSCQRLEGAATLREQLLALSRHSGGPWAEQLAALADQLGTPELDAGTLAETWQDLCRQLAALHALRPALDTVRTEVRRIAQSGAPLWARQLCQQPAGAESDPLLPQDWAALWQAKRLRHALQQLDTRARLKTLAEERRQLEKQLAHSYQELVAQRTWLKLADNATPEVRSALGLYSAAIRLIGKGTGKRAVRYRRDARAAAAMATPAIPCWIMPHYRIAESLPAELGCFDLVIIDEASQSDLSALPALLRARKVLVVGDDKQVSPEGVGLEEDKVLTLMQRFLGDQVALFRPLMTPERSIYDLFKVAFAASAVMLKEHFRSVGPIIEYAKREFYHHELKPLRLPTASERLDPPLIDVLVEDGHCGNDNSNRAEAAFIVEEIRRLAADPATAGRSIGVVSLLGDKQAIKVWELIREELGEALMARHDIACGDARTFQGKERDIMFLSMVVSGKPHAVTRDSFAQRFNVAASRARDRMYLVRSVEISQLSPADELRRKLIEHFHTPYLLDQQQVTDLRTLCESPFETEVYDELTGRGYKVTPQVKVGGFRLDLVVEGDNDARLAIECDGDRYHGAAQWPDDMRRQRILERAGWQFWRCFASTFVLSREAVLQDLLATLAARGITPLTQVRRVASPHVERRTFRASPRSSQAEDTVPA
ncbi:DNA helicase, putative [Pseudogulbenkiania sp. NH8B]|uniref:AAA domain-containing protein n=1 Tax=Pseudogulbenkiania sp. (strain NH8B) TaxID=748280 RepID=UPI0002279E79|nr:AAA domain-containing protein [Pseudogulbenkiania sp. NH8B]BAK77130.1 DNA helicase, putative [Pseudogulbenkiania sp. NH8B]